MLVPADAHLPMAHNDADARNASSAMSPGTLMLAKAGLCRFLVTRLPRLTSHSAIRPASPSWFDPADF